MSHEAESGDLSKLGATLAAGMRWTLLVITPIVAGVAVLREPIIRLLFQRGAFSVSSSHDTSLALLGYLGAVYASGLANLPSRAFTAPRYPSKARDVSWDELTLKAPRWKSSRMM